MYIYIYLYVCVCLCGCVCQLSGPCTCPITAIHSYLLICLDLGVCLFYCWGCFLGFMLCVCVYSVCPLAPVRFSYIYVYILNIYICHIRSTYRVTLASHFCLLSPSACLFFVYVLIVYVRLIRFPIYSCRFRFPFLFFFQLTSNYSYVSISLINSLNIRYLHGLSILNSHFSILTSFAGIVSYFGVGQNRYVCKCIVCLSRGGSYVKGKCQFLKSFGYTLLMSYVFYLRSFLLLACRLPIVAVLPIQFYRILFILDLYHRLIALNTLIILAFLADSLLSLTLMFTVKFIFSFVVSRVFRNQLIDYESV